MKRIAVLFHENDRSPSLYVVDQLAQVWRTDGYEVQYLFGTRRFAPADLLLVHVNLSVVPSNYIQFAKQYQIVINGEISDIRKRKVSSRLLRPGDPWQGRVIVKSDLNLGRLEFCRCLGASETLFAGG
jgi:hypothetical protein